MRVVSKAAITVLTISILLFSSCAQDGGGTSTPSSSMEDTYGPHIELYNLDMPRKVMLRRFGDVQ